MSKKVRKTSTNRQGVVLVTAVAVLLLVSILLTAVVSYVSVNRTKTNDNYKKEQAYLTASSTVQSFVAQIQQDTAKPTDPSNKTALAAQQAKIKALKELAAANGGKGTTVDVSYNGEDGQKDAIGTTTLTIMQDGGSETSLIVLAKTTYAGHTEQVAAHISTDSQEKPKELSNCIELLGETNHNYDNINVIGNMAVLNDSANNLITLDNKASVYGSYSMTGSLEPKGETYPTLVLRESLTEPGKGSSITVSENINFYLRVDSVMEYQLGYNYVNIDGAFNHTSGGCKTSIGSTGHRIDVFCSEANISKKGMEQVGNFNCYSAGSEGRMGNMTINGGSENSTIDGNLQVEGTLKIVDKTLTVTGKTTYGKLELVGSGKLVCSDAKSTSERAIDKEGENKKPGGAAKNQYKYVPEDFFLGSFPETKLIENQYKAFYEGGYDYDNGVYKSSKVNDLWDYRAPKKSDGTIDYYDVDGVKFDYKITGDCEITLDDLSDSRADYDITAVSGYL